MKAFFNRRGVFRALFLSLALGALGISSAMAATGGLRVTVTQPDGTPITGVQVSANSPTSLVSRSGETSANGVVVLRGLIPGTDYTVTVSAPGYADFSADNVAVVADKRLSLTYQLASSDAAELGAITVTGQSFAAVDVTSSSTGEVLTLDIVESLPTGRSYQSYLQLVPAVKPSSTGNPSSRSGVNYANIGGDVGSSSDNLYILDGVNVTDIETGTFGSNINSEIIKQQTVLTGGVPAEYSGGTGLISVVTTKSGSNEFHGSINYYFQDDSLVAENEHNTVNSFSNYDTAFTLGGPIIKDKLWFFLSYQKKYQEQEILNAATGDFLRTVNSDARYGFFKATWQITNRDRLQFTFFNDPTTISGSDESDRLNNRDFTQEQGGDNFKLSYSRQWDSLSLDVYAYQHNAEVDATSKNLTVRNDVAYQGGNPTFADQQLGGGGFISSERSERTQFGLNGNYWLNTDWGTHDIQFGVSFTELVSSEESTIPTGFQYSSIPVQDAGVTLGEYANGTGFTGERDITSGAFGPILAAIAASPDRAYYVGLLDTDGSGTVSEDELTAAQFNLTVGNPYGAVNVYRVALIEENPSEFKTEGTAFYLQDTWSSGQWTANVGFRTEQWVHFASTGQEIFTFDWEIAPRLSVVYDLFGDGTSKVWAFYGRYYDPIRHNMTDFAGNVTGNLTYEQVFLGNRWLTYRQRGGIQTLDAVFAPSTQTPYTDELLLGYAATLAPNVGFELVLDHRKTTDILEDYNEHLYSIGNDGTGVPSNSPYFLTPAYFGYPNGFPDGVNFFIGTLAGGERTYTGLTATLTKYRSDSWMGQVSYTYNHSEGNTSSDSNADFQGDLVRLDPRAPNRYGEMPGNIDHQFQAYGAYYFDNGFEIGGLFQWNSGYAYSKTLAILGRHIPAWSADPDNTFDFGGPGNPYDLPVIEPGTVGAFEAPAYYTLDLRVKYTMDLSVGRAEFFLDIFNAVNSQEPIGEMDVRGGLGPYAFGEADRWVEPRQFYLGVRYSF